MIDPITATIVALVLLLVLLGIGMPIAAGLGLSGLIGMYLAYGPSPSFLGVSTVAFNQVFTFGLLAVPLFIYMGNLLFRHGIGSDLYDTAYKWFGRLPGGLAISSTAVCALFGFICGSATAAAATVGNVALTEMEQRNYDRRLALGTLASAGTLAILIPPSAVMIIYAVVAEASMGWLFIAGIFPGLLLASMFMGYICLRARFQPQLGPPAPPFPFKDMLASLVRLVPAVILFLVILGGIYMGVWSPIEAGAGGAILAFLIALAYRRVTLDKVVNAARDTVKTVVMIYAVIIGANILAYLSYLSGFNRMIERAIMGLAMPNWSIVILMMVILMILGMFFDVVALIMISVPIFLPVIVKLGYDPVWFGILMVISAEMALITPPVGINLYVIQNIAPKGTTVTDVALGAAPFVGVLWIELLLLIFFPEIAMWLPRTMRTG